jgi:hypothetical protein
MKWKTKEKLFHEKYNFIFLGGKLLINIQKRYSVVFSGTSVGIKMSKVHLRVVGEKR